MGALVNGKCYDTNAQALDAFYSSASPAYTAGSTSYLSYYEKSGANWMIFRKSISSSGVVTNLTSSTAPVHVFPTCDPLLPFTDGLAVGWLVVGLMVLAWGLVKLREQLV